jgi:hypothetical protein
MKLLYCAAEWHAFTKMRMHTESTLTHLEGITKELGKLTRKFEQATCLRYTTSELQREAEARPKRRGKNRQQQSGSSKRPKFLNLFMYKWHALADYVPTIRLFGGSDGFSTQIVRASITIGISRA